MKDKTRFEVWNARAGVFMSPRDKWTFRDMRDAFRYVHWRRKRIRVRHFYDRHQGVRIVQILAGNGYGSR